MLYSFIKQADRTQQITLMPKHCWICCAFHCTNRSSHDKVSFHRTLLCFDLATYGYANLRGCIKCESAKMRKRQHWRNTKPNSNINSVHSTNPIPNPNPKPNQNSNPKHTYWRVACYFLPSFAFSHFRILHFRTAPNLLGLPGFLYKKSARMLITYI